MKTMMPGRKRRELKEIRKEAAGTSKNYRDDKSMGDTFPQPHTPHLHPVILGKYHESIDSIYGSFGDSKSFPNNMVELYW